MLSVSVRPTDRPTLCCELKDDMVILDSRTMLSSPGGAAASIAAAAAASNSAPNGANQYLNPDYLAPLPTEVSAS